MIIARRLPSLPQGSALVESAIDRFRAIRNEKGLEKAPGTAELIAFVALLLQLGKDPDRPLELSEDDTRQCAGVLGKTRRDEEKIRELLAG
jgi:MoxR-like ATPase